MTPTFRWQSLLGLLLLISSCLATATQTSAPADLPLDPKVGRIAMERHLQYACTELADGLDAATRLPYQAVTTPRISLGYTNKACWFRFRLSNPGNDTLRLVLGVHFPMLDHVTLHIPRPEGVQVMTAGDAEPYGIRTLRIRFFSYPFDLEPHTHQDYYLKVHTTSSFNLPITLSDRDTFIEEAINNEWILGTFYGIGIGLFFYNFFLWITIRERTYLFYIIHLGSSLLFYAALQGIAYRWWPDWPDWSTRSPYVFAYLSMVSGTLFARAFLRTTEWPRTDRLLLGMVFLGLFAAIGQFVLPAHIINPFLGIAALLNMVLLTGTGIMRWRKGQQEARIFVLAWGMFLVSLFAVALNTYGILNTLAISLYGMQVGLILQQILLSLALAYRINSLKKEKLLQEEASHLARSENEAKGNFLATMSHEIRTPMNAVIGITHLLRDTRLDASQRNYVDLLHSSGQSLLSLINDILDYSKINAGKLELEHAVFNLHELLGECANMFSANARQKSLKLSFEPAPDLPRWVRGDPARLRQVLVNLLSNALKFTEEGTICLRAGLLPQHDAEHVCLSVQLEDSGIGMNAAEADHIFQAFRQADSGTSRKYGGSGLGLAISKQIIEMMGGRIGVSSVPGKGSTFWFTALLQSATEPGQTDTAKAASPHQLHDLRVLVVEDNPVNRLVIIGLLHKLGIRELVANHGEEALAVLEEHADIDLILMDCEMPIMDGYTATRHIRAREHDLGLPAVPIIALTAHALPEHRAKCLACGMNDHLTKPVAMEDLMTALQQWQGKRPPRNDSPLTEPSS